MIDLAIQPVRGRLLNTAQACEYLGMPMSRLRRLVARKKIPVIRDGRLGFYERDLDDWILEHRTPAGAAARTTVPRVSQPAQEPHGIDDLLRDIKRRGGSPFDDAAHGDEDASTPGGHRRRKRESVHA